MERKNGGCETHTGYVDHSKLLEEALDSMELQAINTSNTNEVIAKDVCELIIKHLNSKQWDITKHQGEMYLYNGSFWKLIDEAIIIRFLGQASEQLGIPSNLAKLTRFRKLLLEQIFQHTIIISESESSEGVVINLKNGLFAVNEEKLELKKHDRKMFLTYELDFEYSSNAEAPQFQKFLNEVLPNRDMQKLLAEFLGSVFIKNSTLKLEKALMHYGSGANGKSVVMDLVTGVLGNQNVSSYSMESLTQDKKYSRINIKNKFLNYSSEISSTINPTDFKTLASGEPIEAR